MEDQSLSESKPYAETLWQQILKGLAIASPAMLIYGAVVLYKSAYANALHFPVRFMTIERADIARHGIIYGVVALLLVLILDAFSFGGSRLDNKWANLSLAHAPFLYVVILNLGLVRAFDLAVLFWLAFPFLMFAVSVVQLCGKKKRDVAPTDTHMGQRLGISGVVVLTTGMSMLAFLATAHVWGEADARRQERYFVVAGSPPQAILGMEGDTAVVAPLDREHKEVASERRMISLKDGSVTFQWETVGPLKIR